MQSLRPQGLFLEKKCHQSTAFIYGLILIYLHTNILYENILFKLKFQHSRATVKVLMAILIKLLLCFYPFILEHILMQLHINV